MCGIPIPYVDFFLVDNLTVLQTLNKVRVIGKLAAALIGAAQDCMTVSKCVFRWIKSHSGCAGNNAAVRLAKVASRSGKLESMCMSMSYIKQKIRNRLTRIWNQRWASLTSSRMSRELITFEPDRNNERYVLG